MTPSEFFQNQHASSATRANLHAGKVKSLAAVRIAVFIGFLILIVLFANARNGLGVTLSVALFPIVFGIIVQRFNKQQRARKLFTEIASRYTKESARLSHELESIDGGDEFVDRSHPFSYDLDLFGRHSLFAMLNRASTPDGRKKLAHWMLDVPSAEDLLLRQAAVKELKTDPAWMIHFLAEGQQDVEAPIEELRQWLNEEEEPKPLVPLWLGPLLTIVLFVVLYMVIYSNWPIYALAPPVLINVFVLRKLQQPLLELGKRISGNVKILRGYENMVKMFHDRSFESERLRDLHSPFTDSSVASIQSLRKLLDFLDGRSNMFYATLDLFLLLDVYLYHALKRWKSRNKADLSAWFENIAEVEVLGSLSLHAYANPTAVLPEFSKELCWESTRLGHPLIPVSERVENDFSMGSGVSIITGSNMSGKSTFLRTVGINTVLAFMGSVVTASSLKLSRLQIYTAMRTEDDLKSHISSFYAELKRIRGLLDAIDELPTLCLLDEILKGTNTEDRHRGAMGLLMQLSRQNVVGMVSTHDLALGKWGEEKGFPNFSFNSTIEGNEISFDYKISQGVCHSFNASQLMLNMGIELPPSE